MWKVAQNKQVENALNVKWKYFNLDGNCMEFCIVLSSASENGIGLSRLFIFYLFISAKSAEMFPTCIAQQRASCNT